MRYVYRLNCFYNLHGLSEPRCPECGRRFEPKNPATYSLSPDPARFSRIVQQVAIAINETVHSFSPPDAIPSREASLRRRIALLEQANAVSDARFDTLLQILSARGLLETEQLAAVLAAVPSPANDPLACVVDDRLKDQENDSEALVDLSDSAHALPR